MCCTLSLVENFVTFPRRNQVAVTRVLNRRISSRELMSSGRKWRYVGKLECLIWYMYVAIIVMIESYLFMFYLFMFIYLVIYIYLFISIYIYIYIFISLFICSVKNLYFNGHLQLNHFQNIRNSLLRVNFATVVVEIWYFNVFILANF